MTLEDTDGELHEDGQAIAERAPPGILDQGRVAVVEEFGRRVPSQSGDVPSPADDPNDDDNLSDTVSVDSVERLHPTLQQNQSSWRDFRHAQDGVGHVGRG